MKKSNEPIDARIRLAIAQWPDDAPRGSVTSFCAEHGISRKTFYAIRARARAEGQTAALEPRSRRPKTSPARITEDVQQQTLGVRNALESSGLDHRPTSVHDKMLSMGISPPSVASLAQIFQLEDDHSRRAVASHVADSEATEAAIAVVEKGIAACGVPQRLLTDNHTALNPERMGRQSQLVSYVKSLGVEPITGRPDRPTTQGKNKRFHQTLFRWLDKQPLAATCAQLQAQVDEFDQIYDTERGHQGLPGRMIPQQA